MAVQAIVTDIQTVLAPAAALRLGLSNTAAFNYSAPINAYVNITFASWPLSFSLLKLDSLMSNPDQNSGGYTIANNSIGLNRGRGDHICSTLVHLDLLGCIPTK